MSYQTTSVWIVQTTLLRGQGHTGPETVIVDERGARMLSYNTHTSSLSTLQLGKLRAARFTASLTPLIARAALYISAHPHRDALFQLSL